jgi:hypothetical protein
METEVYKVVDDHWVPEFIPFNRKGIVTEVELRKIDHKGSYSISVGYKWQIHHNVQAFDTLVFYSGGYEVVFQVIPTDKPKRGRLVFIKKTLLPTPLRSRNLAGPSRYPICP